jgi:circadian clock protein KaiC
VFKRSFVSESSNVKAIEPVRVSTGIGGFDEVLGGGLPQGHLYLIEGESGAGKTTVGLQFLREGRRHGEATLWISLSETQQELRQIAESHGWSLEGVELCNPTAAKRTTHPDEQYSFFSPADVELEDIRAAIVDAVERVAPTRVVFDPFSDIRHLARDVLRYRRYVLYLREFFTRRQCTVLLMQEMSRGAPGDLQAEALVHGYVALHQDSPEYGGQRRRLRVHKMRGTDFRGGYHDFCIETGGIEVYPRLIASEYFGDAPEETVASGVAALDQLLGGGVERGSTLLIMGTAGVGKSTLATQYAATMTSRGERAAVFIFDETIGTFRARSHKLGLDLGPAIADGTLRLRQIDSAEVSPGQFAHMVRRAVDDHGARLVIIDSISGYLGAMPEERFLFTHLHELLMSLAHRNVVTILTLAQHGLLGERVESPADISYLADSVVLIRYFEAFGAIRRAVSVVKKRTGAHERNVREMTIAHGGVQIGEPLRQFSGVLSGRPEFTGDLDQLSVDES